MCPCFSKISWDRRADSIAGADPLPDTFRDGAQALADGRMGRDGVFHASKIQAKCASKYEAKPGNLRSAPAPPINKT